MDNKLIEIRTEAMASIDKLGIPMEHLHRELVVEQHRSQQRRFPSQ